MSQENQLPEVWMRGPVDGVPPLLQPVAHVLLQVAEDARKYTEHLAANLLWERPNHVASVGFHLRHIVGVIDRLFTYAQEQPLSEQQFAYLREEGTINNELATMDLLDALDRKVIEALEQLKQTSENELTAIRYLGRKRIPTTLIGLLFHAAEHAQRHLGQLLVTTRILQL